MSRASAEAQGVEVSDAVPEPVQQAQTFGMKGKKGKKMMVVQTVSSDKRLSEDDLPEPISLSSAPPVKNKASPVKVEEDNLDIYIKESDEVIHKEKKKKKKDKEKKGPDTEQWSKMALEPKESNWPVKKRKGAMAFDAKEETGTGDMDDFKFYDGEKPIMEEAKKEDEFPAMSEVNKQIAAME